MRRVGIKLKYVLVPRQGQDETLRELKNCTPCEKCNEELAADSCGCFCVADCRGLVGAANALLAPVNVSPGMCHFGYGGKRSPVVVQHAEHLRSRRPSFSCVRCRLCRCLVWSSRRHRECTAARWKRVSGCATALAGHPCSPDMSRLLGHSSKVCACSATVYSPSSSPRSCARFGGTPCTT